eukprot:1386022-Amphidinium_carterae.1
MGCPFWSLASVSASWCVQLSLPAMYVACECTFDGFGTIVGIEMIGNSALSLGVISKRSIEFGICQRNSAYLQSSLSPMPCYGRVPDKKLSSCRVL